MTCSSRLIVLFLALSLAGCLEPATKSSPPITPPEDRPTAPVVRAPLPGQSLTAPKASPTSVPAAVVLPPGAVYVCVAETGGQVQQTVIEFPSPTVRELCRKNPEMGPCQYEREACRHGGGRVFAADGVEITRQTEAEYDRRVLRVRFKSN